MSPDLTPVTTDGYPVDVTEVPAGEFTADDLGLSELEDHHRAYRATSPAWPDLTWVDATPARAAGGLRLLIADRLAAGATPAPAPADVTSTAPVDDPLPGLGT